VAAEIMALAPAIKAPDAYCRHLWRGEPAAHRPRAGRIPLPIAWTAATTTAPNRRKCRSSSVSSETFKTMFDNLALACRLMLSGPHGRAVGRDRSITVLYGAPPAVIDLVIVSFQNHDRDRPMFDPSGAPWPERLVLADERLDPFPFGGRLRRVFSAHGLTDTLRERTLAINAVYPDAPLCDSEFWLRGEGSYGVWRRFSTNWTALVIEQIRPKAVLLAGRKAALAIRHKLGDMPAVEAVHFAMPTAGDDDAIYDAPFDQLVELLGTRR
jgi:hypothetical protein